MNIDLSKYSTLQRFRLLLKASGTRLLSFTLPTLFALIASFGEGLTLVFLIPTIKGLIDPNYHIFYSLPAFIRRDFPTIKEFSGNEAILFCLILTFFFALIKIVFAYLTGVSTAKNLKLFSARLRTQLYERYLSFGKLYFDRSNTGHLQQVITTYVSLISTSLGSIQSSIYAATTLTVYMAIMLIISAKLTLIVLLAFPLLHFSLRWLIKRIDTISREHTAIYNQLVKRISNALSTIALVKAYSKEKPERDKFSKLANQVGAIEFSIERNTLLVGPIQEFILLCFLFFLVGVVALVFVKDTPGAMANYAVYFVVLKRAATLFGVFASIGAALAAVSGPIAETTEILSNKDKFFVANGSVTFEGLVNGIEFKDLKYHYPEGTTALNSVNFYFERGSTIAVVGHSGSGKTTLIHLLMRFYDSPPGTILVDGQDVRSFSIESWRSHIALVSQDTLLFNATLRENIIYGIRREVKDEELTEVLAKARLDSFVCALPRGLETEIGDHGIKLSGGERQRVSIARAILKNADILLLDEATSALDSMTEKLLQQALENLTEGKTTLIVAHRLSTVRSADQIIVLENGKIVEQGEFRHLVDSKGAFAAFWNEQRI